MNTIRSQNGRVDVYARKVRASAVKLRVFIRGVCYFLQMPT